MFQTDQVVAAVATAFQANADMIALCPGGVWHRRGLDEQHGGKRPLAVLVVVPQDDKQFITDFSCVQSFSVEVGIIGDQRTDTTGLIASYLCVWDFNKDIFSELEARVVGLFPRHESLDLSPEEKVGEDVVLVSKAWTLLLHYATKTVPIASLDEEEE